MTRRVALWTLACVLVPCSVRAAGLNKLECIAANDAAQELRRAGKLREAREKLLLCGSASCPGLVRQDCAERLTEVNAVMPTVVFEIKDGDGIEASGIAIAMDGQSLAGALAGTAIAVDPGDHIFTFGAPGLPSTARRLMIIEGAKGRREVVVMGVSESPPAASPSATPTAVPHTPSGPPTYAWVAFGTGGAGLALGVAAGLVAGGKHSTLSGECDNKVGTCAPQFAGDLDTFHTWRTLSTIGYVVGALGVAGGAVLWLTAPKVPSPTAGLWIGPASAGFAGVF